MARRPSTAFLQRDLPEDLEYRMGLLTGPEGTWHRLWAALTMQAAGQADAQFVEAMHNALADLIGRRLLPSEFEALRTMPMNTGGKF